MFTEARFQEQALDTHNFLYSLDGFYMGDFTSRENLS
jgi:hypothetical protein